MRAASNGVFALAALVTAISGMLLPVPRAYAADAADDRDAKWGHLEFRFVYDGMDPPKQEKLIPKRDVAVMSRFEILDERLIVDRKSLGIMNVVVYLLEKDPPIHASYDKSATSPVSLTFDRGRLQPHVVCLRTTQVLQLRNTMPIGCNVKVSPIRNQGFNVVLPGGGLGTQRLKDAESIPSFVSNAIHPWVRGWLLVRDSPYMGASEKSGVVRIRNLPAGVRTFRLWHEEVGYLRGIGTKRGRWEIKIPAGGTRRITIKMRKEGQARIVESISHPIVRKTNAKP